mmetsp:Transcript_7710/g.8483  ORF Transcript_7710/g.8483 Transcript_7710/m.8483 type:complete len:100 (+) Transcript_7710:495-794(+)
MATIMCCRNKSNAEIEHDEEITRLLKQYEQMQRENQLLKLQKKNLDTYVMKTREQANRLTNKSYRPTRGSRGPNLLKRATFNSSQEKLLVSCTKNSASK